MKKFMFSAIALVAFSFAGMANNSVEENIFSETKNNIEIVSEAESLKSDTPCADKWELTYDGLRDVGYSHEYALGYADSIFNQCMTETYPSIE